MKKDFARTNILVSIQCLTYNHKKYIRQCLDGFVMQKTTFCFEAIVHDDASTDGTAEIVREYAEKYPDIIKPIYEEENQYSKHIPGLITNIVNKRCQGKYIAICEGDDYWIDPLKLQKQVDALESDDSLGVVYTKAKKVDNKTGKVIEILGEKYKTFDDLIIKNRIPTLTVCYRKELYDLYTNTVVKNLQGVSLGDYPMWLFFALRSKIVFIDKICAVYRVLEESASHSTSSDKMIRYHTTVYKICLFYVNNFPNSLKNKEKVLFSIEDRFEWCKYRVLQAEAFPKRIILSNDTLKKMSLRHKLIYSINKYALKLGYLL